MPPVGMVHMENHAGAILNAGRIGCQRHVALSERWSRTMPGPFPLRKPFRFLAVQHRPCRAGAQADAATGESPATAYGTGTDSAIGPWQAGGPLDSIIAIPHFPDQGVVFLAIRAKTPPRVLMANAPAAPGSARQCQDDRHQRATSHHPGCASRHLFPPGHDTAGDFLGA